MGPLPIIRLEIEGMKIGILKALDEYRLQLDDTIRRAVEAYCTKENMDRVVHDAATSAINFVIKEEVDNFFRYGPGRKVVLATVEQKLKGYTDEE